MLMEFVRMLYVCQPDGCRHTVL